MSFTTLHFFLFLAMGVLIYYLLPKKLQWVWLLVLSYLYYFTFSIKTSVFLIFTTVVTYTGGILLTRMNESSKAYLAANKETLDRAAKKAYKEKVKKNTPCRSGNASAVLRTAWRCKIFKFRD